MSERAIQLRDEIVRLLRDAIPSDEELPDLPSVEPIDEPDGTIKAMVIDQNADCFRITIEQI